MVGVARVAVAMAAGARPCRRTNAAVSTTVNWTHPLATGWVPAHAVTSQRLARPVTLVQCAVMRSWVPALTSSKRRERNILGLQREVARCE